MIDDNWNEVLEVLQEELRKIGKFDIADVSNYGTNEKQELVRQMLIALHSELCARSPKLLEHALDMIDKIVEGDGPAEVLICVEKSETGGDRPKDSTKYIPLRNDDITDAIEEIENAYFEIFGTKIEGV